MPVGRDKKRRLHQEARTRMRVRDELHFQGHAADWRGRRTPGNGAGWSGFHRQREGAQAAHADGEAGWAAAPCRVQRPPAAALTRERQGAAKAGGRTRPDSRAFNCSGRDWPGAAGRPASLGASPRCRENCVRSSASLLAVIHGLFIFTAFHKKGDPRARIRAGIRLCLVECFKS